MLYDLRNCTVNGPGTPDNTDAPYPDTDAQPPDPQTRPNPAGPPNPAEPGPQLTTVAQAMALNPPRGKDGPLVAQPICLHPTELPATDSGSNWYALARRRSAIVWFGFWARIVLVWHLSPNSDTVGSALPDQRRSRFLPSSNCLL
uniref:Uncharacterized protein n=1 Tax=Anopheles culicifacies TaxID=139723 RepID=A0A182MPR1_9DIPT